MAQCTFCQQDMLEADGCVDDPIIIGGIVYGPVRFGDEDDFDHPSMRFFKPKPGDRCGDCNVLFGRVHHHGCDMEDCPECGLQSISCGCLWAGEEDDECTVWFSEDPART